MKLRTIICGSLLSLAFTVDATAQKNEKPDAAFVINKAIEAAGGKEALLAVRTVYSEMSTEMEGRKVIWVTKEMLPNKGAFQIVYNNRVVFQNFYDGTTGYEIVNGQKQKANPEEFKNKAYKRNIFNELDYLDSTLWKLELIGEEKVNKEPCYTVKATCVSGEQLLLYYSKSSFYLLRKDRTANTEKDRISVSWFSDFKKEGNITDYTTMKYGDPKKPTVGKVIKVLYNEQVSEEDFKK